MSSTQADLSTLPDKMNQFRQEALYYSGQGKRFKILIETVTGCFGSCLGCALTSDERTQFAPKISKDDLARVFQRLTGLLDYTQPDSIVSPYETTVINYGASEHFIYDNGYLGDLFGHTAQFFRDVKTSRNVLAFSSSGLMNTDKMFDRSRDMLQQMDKDQFVVDFVIDLARFDKLKGRYQQSLDFFQEQFGFVDLAINIEAFSDIRDWHSFCEFVDQNCILNVDLIYSLNKNNVHRVPLEAKKIFQIYETVVKNTQKGKALFDLHGLLRIKKESQDLEDLTLQQICRKAAKNILHDAIFINANFEVYPVLFVIFADVPLSERLDFKPIGNLFDSDFAQKFHQYENEIYTQLLRISAKSMQCNSCHLVKECYQTGAPLLNRYLNTFKGQTVVLPEDCQNPVRPFLLAKENNYLVLREDSIN